MPEKMDPSTWDLRADGTPKGNGFLGVLARPDGRVSSEISIGTEDVIPGKELEIPTLVPTLTESEVRYLLTKPEKAKIPDAIVNKAIEFAKERLKQGRPVFAEPGEQLHHVYPQLPRLDQPVGTFNDMTIRPMASHP